MKMLRTLPFVMAALLVVWASATGTNSGLMWVMGVLLCVVATAMSAFGYANLPVMWGFSEVPETPRLQRSRRVILGLSLAIIFSTLALHWPLRACFWLSRPALERVARQGLQARGAPIRMPQRAGFFTIQDVDFDRDEAVLWLDGDGGEPTILVRQSPGSAPRRNGSDRIDLDSQWYFYSEM